MDKYSVDQSLRGNQLLEAVADFTRLFSSIPTIAAYDTAPSGEDGRHFLRRLRRPWIAKELLAMRPNTSEIHYVGHITGQGAAEDFGFRHMVNRIWDTSFANSILYVLTGYCDMHDVSELPLITPEHAPLLSAVSNKMTRVDALLAAAILTQILADERVNGDLNIRELDFQVFQFVETETSVGFWNNWHVLLNGEVIACWSEKEYTRDGMPRRKLSASTNANEILAKFLNIEIPPFSLGQSLGTVTNMMEKRTDTIKVYDLCSLFGD